MKNEREREKCKGKDPVARAPDIKCFVTLNVFKEKKGEIPCFFATFFCASDVHIQYNKGAHTPTHY